MNKSWGPGHGQKSVKGPYEEETDEETSRKAGRANKVTSGDALCARKSILLPHTWKVTEVLQETRSRKESSMNERSTATSRLGAAAMKWEQQTCLQVDSEK